jgi:hypothetical protein
VPMWTTCWSRSARWAVRRSVLSSRARSLRDTRTATLWASAGVSVDAERPRCSPRESGTMHSLASRDHSCHGARVRAAVVHDETD